MTIESIDEILYILYDLKAELAIAKIKALNDINKVYHRVQELIENYEDAHDRLAAQLINHELKELTGGDLDGKN